MNSLQEISMAMIANKDENHLNFLLGDFII